MTAFLWCIFAYMGVMLVADLLVAREEGVTRGDVFAMLLHAGLLGGSIYFLTVT